MEWISKSPEETMALGASLLEHFPDAKLICLRGPLGSGKTCFTKGIGHSLGIDPKTIKSPTFTTLFEHRGDRMLYHCDFYRYEKGADLDPDWWVELLEHPTSLVVAEWSERIEAHLPLRRLEIEFSAHGEGKRKITLQTLT